jgi:cysteine synthase A
MPKLGLGTEVVDRSAYDHSVERFREARITLPTFAQLTEPASIAPSIIAGLEDIAPDSPDPRNLFRVHWCNDADRRHRATVPQYLELPRQLTGVDARIVLMLGDTFPMIRAHKVLAAYGCLAPRIVTGQFDPTEHRAVWPSTGNYCRGGVAISRIMGCHGVAVLPEGMSRERFDWLDQWVTDPQDIVRTPGSESNVKEIYDRCAELEADPQNIVFNQFSEFGNYLIHYSATGRAAEMVFEDLCRSSPELRLQGWVSASGSAGTLGAGDYLKERHGSRIVAVEALECPTLLYNGFGEHNIQGIGDKHVPFIHNVMNTDVVTAVSDRSTDALAVLFASKAGRAFLEQRAGVDPGVIEQLHHLGLSSICNVLAAIKTARHFDLGADDLLLTVATDGAEMYVSEHQRILERDYPNGFEKPEAEREFGRHVEGLSIDHLLDLTEVDRERIFNLGYFTWVEQLGVDLDDFVARKQQGFWKGLHQLLDAWDERIEEFNQRSGQRAG